MHLTIVRHGATANNLEGRFTGQSDVPLSALGERQATLLAERLADECFDAIVSSDLRRAQATAEAIARQHDTPLALDADLREIGMGAWEGRTLAEVAATDAALLAAWQQDGLEVVPLGGEALPAFRNRLVRALDRWQARVPDGRVLMVTHGAAIEVLLCHLLGMDLTRRWQFRRDNAALSALDIQPRGAILLSLNDTGHLRALSADAAGERFQVM